MNCNEATMSLGVYLVGSLDPAERAEVDAHLQECAACRAELDEIAMLPSVLDKLSLEDVGEVLPVPVPSEDLFARVAAQARAEADAPDDAPDPADELAEVTPLRRRPRWQTIAAAAAAVVVIGGVSVTAVGVLQSSNGPKSVTVQEHGVRMQVALSSQAAGTGLRIAISGLPKDEHCRLIAVANDGTTDFVGQWDATYAGEWQMTGSTSIETSNLSKLVLYDRSGAELVTVPV
ncbi:MAG TPA: zf-HC2 domain-containing protein [Mycobacteriales bacterium]|nr:zf-HC2 domain-containing protein [Mycobacteriales bacterium]